MRLHKIANYVYEKKRAENSQTDGLTAVQRKELGVEQATCEPNVDENTKFKTPEHFCKSSLQGNIYHI